MINGNLSALKMAAKTKYKALNYKLITSKASNPQLIPFFL